MSCAGKIHAISDAELRIQDIIAAYKDAYDEAYGSISGQYALWDSAEKVVSTSAASINNALQSQITYWDNYNQNLEKLNERAADIDGLSEVIASFADGSKESVNAIAGMASASDADLAKMVENYAALKEAQDTTSESIADLKTGMSNSMDEIAQTVADTVSEMDMSDEATESAKATIQGFIDGASGMMPRVQEAYAKIASAASTALAGSNERYNANHGIPGYAVGTEDAAPGFAIVGEHGPELVYFNGGESVLTASETRREMESASVTPMSAELPESSGASSARSTAPISLSPVYHISGISDTSELQNVLNGSYGSTTSTSGAFTMNTSNTNSGGWGSSQMRSKVLGSASSPTSPTANTLLAALPADLRAVMKSCTKYTDNKGGGNTASNVSSTTDYLFLLSEYEVFATHQYCNDAEPNYQAQYDYFKAGNSKVANKHSATGTAAVWWLRSPYYYSISIYTYFCAVSSSGSLGCGYADYAYGVVPGFVV